MANKQNLVIFHGNCPDGFTAAWLFWRWLGEDAQYVAAGYGDPPPDVAGRNVYLVDFSYPRDVLLRMNEEAASLLVLDHHKTAEEALAGLPFCVFDLKQCGSQLAAIWLMREVQLRLDKVDTEFILYVADNDLWTRQLANTDEVRAAYLATPFEFAVWTEFVLEGKDQWVKWGRLILAYHRLIVEHHKKQRFLMNVGGHVVPAFNLTIKDVVSMLLHEACQGERFAVAFWFNGRKWEYSLRSDEQGEDVSDIAKLFGGGGHKHAAGFQLLECDRVLRRLLPLQCSG
jgi:nanoRNase/pAp phosphatase (c-di-AMP/oligoRNAs hydrolase)